MEQFMIFLHAFTYFSLVGDRGHENI